MVRLSKAERREIIQYATRQVEYNGYSMTTTIRAAFENVCPRAIDGDLLDVTRKVYTEIEKSVVHQIEMDRQIAESCGKGSKYEA